MGGAPGVLVIALLFLIATSGQARAATAAPKPLGCLIQPDRVADLGAQVIGLVGQVRVERGDVVGANDVLVTLRADVETANARVTSARAQVEADVLAARSALELAAQKLDRATALAASNFVSPQAVEQARAEKELANQRLHQALSQQQISREEHRVAEAQVALRTVRAPFAGVITDRWVNAGERVEDKPMLRLASVDPLRVELLVPTSEYGSVAVGDQLTIHPEITGAAPVQATVRSVDAVLDAASNTFRVRLSLPNPHGRLPAGLRCRADLPVAGAVHVPGAPGATRAAPAVNKTGQTRALRLELDLDPVVGPSSTRLPSL